ncbi:MAG: DUF3971 domain-containing protein [Alphaproteobacteria bacterium]|nr:DUF3971 domain-containing protein [Alphaproteobacteria bacterium]
MIRRTGSILGKAIAAVLSIVILVLIGTGAMLSQGPLSIAPLAPYLEDMLDDPAWPFLVRFDDAVLSWEGWQKKLDVRVVGARFLDRGGAELISVPRMSIAFDGQALFAGQFRVIGLQLIEPRLRLLRHKDGGIEIANNEADARADAPQGLRFAPGLLDGSGGETGMKAFGDLRELSVRGADLTFHDAVSGLDFAVPSADLSLRQEAIGVSMRLSTRLRIGQSEAALGISALYREESAPIVAAMNFAEVDIAALAEIIGDEALTRLRGVNLTAAGRLDLMVLPDGVVDNLKFDVTTGPGQILLPELHSKAMPVVAMAAKGEFVDNLSLMKLADLRLDLGDDLVLRADGEWQRTPAGGMSLRGKGEFENLRAEKLPLYWPETLGVDARTWVLKHVHAGMVPKGSFSVDLRPGDLQLAKPRAGMVQLDWVFQDAAADYFGELPPLRAAHGSGHVDAREFRLAVQGASAGGLQLSEGSLLVADLSAARPVLDIEFVAHGGVQEALVLLDAKPLQFAQALAVKPEDTSGTSATRARFRIPLIGDLTLDQVGFSAAANLAELSLRQIPGGYALDGGAFSLTVGRDALQMTGQGSVNGVPLQLSWKRNFHVPTAAPGDHLILHGTVADEQWTHLGLPKMSRLRGAVNMAVSVDVYDNGARRGAGRFDLTGAAVDLNEIGWRKPGSVPAKMNMTFQANPNGETVIDLWEISGAGLAARGSAKLAPGGGLISLYSEDLALGATRLAVDMSTMPGGGYRLHLTGPSLDLRPFVLRWQDDAVSAEEPPLDLNLQIEQVLLTDGVVVRQLLGTGQRREGKWLAANMRGFMADGQSVGFTVRAENKGRRYIVVAGDAGAMARALGFYNDARGGVMYLNFLVPDQNDQAAPVAGKLRADNFRVVKAPVLTKLLTLGSLQGLGDVLNDKGIAFTRLDVPFTMQGGQLHIERGRAVGPALALIATGDYGRADESLQFQGTIVPSYTINSVLGAIPILGDLLIGRKGEGVFAFTYKVAGNLEKPKISVNLLSALAPGFLRRIVDGLDKPAVGETELEPRIRDQ